MKDAPISILLSTLTMVGMITPSMAAEAEADATAATTAQTAPAAQLPTSLQTSSASTTAPQGPTGVYSALQQAWDDCFNIKTLCTEMLDEGRFAPARKKWVDYYTSSISQAIADLKTSTAQIALPGELEASGQPLLSDIQTANQTFDTHLQALQASADSLKTPTDGKYPATFWSPAKDLLGVAGSVDKSLVAVLALLDNHPDSATRITTGANGSVKLHGGIASVDHGGSLEGLVTASTKIDDACLKMASELDRFNLSFAKAPTQPLQNEMYQGAFTKQEILNQYKYMPSFVFTTDSSVARFTYRLPPRRNMLAHYAIQVGKLLNLMDSEMQSIQANIPASKQDALAGPWEAMKQKYVDARNQYMTIFNLLKDATDEKLAVDIRQDQTVYGAPVLAIREDMKQLRTAINDFIPIAK